MIDIVDISSWQEHPNIPGDVDFRKMATLAQAVIIKRSQSTRTDPDGARFYANSKGIIRRGAYHYLDWDSDPIEQVDHFWGLIKDDIGEIPPSLDFEERNGAPEAGAARNFLRAAIERIFYHLRSVGWDVLNRPPMLYTGPSYWAEFGSADLWWLCCDLWIANYGATKPQIPRPWYTCRLWQDGFADGTAHGVESKEIDHNIYMGQDFYAWSLPLPCAPDPESEPPSEEIMQKYQVVNTSGLNLRSEPTILSSVVTVWPYLGTLTATGATHSNKSGTDAWVQVQHATLGPLWAAWVYNGKKYLQPIG